jgi:hypothetical protein
MLGQSWAEECPNWVAAHKDWADENNDGYPHTSCVKRTRTGIQQILTFSSFLATDLIDLLSAIETHSHFRSTSERVAIAQQMGIGFGDKDLSLSAGDIFIYTVLIRELEPYGKTYLPMEYENRPHLRPAESHCAAESFDSSDLALARQD